MRIKTMLATTALVVCGLAGQANAATNLISNGDFSSPNTGGGWQISAGSAGATLGGWTSGNRAGVEIGASGTYGLPAAPGNAGGQNLEVNGFTFGDVYQVVNLVAGQSYTLSLLYGGRTSGGTQALNILAGGTILNASPLTGSTGVWTPESYQFVATGGAEKIEFQALVTSGSESFGNEVTNVSLSAVPEPASWALMLTGFGMIGYALRSMKRKVLRFAA